MFRAYAHKVSSVGLAVQGALGSPNPNPEIQKSSGSGARRTVEFDARRYWVKRVGIVKP